MLAALYSVFFFVRLYKNNFCFKIWHKSLSLMSTPLKRPEIKKVPRCIKQGASEKKKKIPVIIRYGFYLIKSEKSVTSVSELWMSRFLPIAGLHVTSSTIRNYQTFWFFSFIRWNTFQELNILQVFSLINRLIRFTVQHVWIFKLLRYVTWNGGHGRRLIRRWKIIFNYI